MEFFQIHNWEKFQHYSKRNPPWIRLYQTLLRDIRYQRLTDTQRSHLIGLFLLAAQNDNKLSANQGWLKHELCTKAPIDLKTLAASGWIDDITKHASKNASASNNASKDATPETETETDNSETEVQRQNTETEKMIAYGEFKHVKLSLDQYTNLKAKLNGNLDQYIVAFDHWVNEAPEAKHAGVRRKNRHAYESIVRWYDRDVKEGRINLNGNGKHVQTFEERVKELDGYAAKHGK